MAKNDPVIFQNQGEALSIDLAGNLKSPDMAKTINPSHFASLLIHGDRPREEIHKMIATMRLAQNNPADNQAMKGDTPPAAVLRLMRSGQSGAIGIAITRPNG